MKRLSVTMLILIVSTAVNAQKTSIGVQAGLTLSSYKVKSSGLGVTSDSKAGFMAGVILDVGIDPHFSFQPQLNFVQKGGILKADDGANSGKVTTTLNYLELPLNFLYKAPTSGGNFFVGLGPALSYGLSGKHKIEVNGQTEKEDVSFGSGADDDLKRFDLGINGLIGYHFNPGLFLSVNYDQGLLNLNNSSGDSYRNHFFGFTLGYLPLKKGMTSKPKEVL